MNKTIELKAYAKINLCLDVLGKREDGYHIVDMIMQSIGLYDEIRIEDLGKENKGKILLKVKDLRNIKKRYSTIEKDTAEYCGIDVAATSNNAEETAEIPTDKNNLMYKAAELMIKRYCIDSGISMTLIKRIPSEAGLGGGSADAAAVLRGLNELFGIGASFEKLMELGAKIGSDIPFCVMGGTARAEGTGTKMTALRPIKGNKAFPQYVLLIKPELSGSTPKIYSAYDDAKEPLGERLMHPDTARLSDAVNSAADEALMKTFLENNINVLEYAVNADIIDTLKDELLKNGAVSASMTGSGSVVYGLFETESKMQEAAANIMTKSYDRNIVNIIETVIST